MKHSRPISRYYIIVAAQVLAAALGGLILITCGGSNGGGGGAVLSLAQVSPLYATNGSDWNDYISNDGTDIYNATDTACDPAADGPGYSGCMHGGQMRSVQLIGAASCDGFAAYDNLSAFKWDCLDNGSTVRFVSTGFVDNKGLSDLLNFDTLQWRSNKVTVTLNGTTAASTPSTIWWDNTVASASTGGLLSGAGTVYVVNATSISGMTIGADNIALAIDPALTIIPTSGITIVSATSRNFLWITGAMDGAGVAYYGVTLTDTHFSVLHNVSVSNINVAGTGTGVTLLNCTRNALMDVNIQNTGGRGMEVNSSGHNLIKNVNVASTGMQGVALTSSHRNALDSIKATNTGTTSTPEGSAVQLLGSTYNTLTHVSSSNSRMHGLHLKSDSPFNTLIDVTATSNSYAGVSVESPNNFLSGVTAVANENNSSTGGLNISSSSNVVQDAALADNVIGLKIFNLYNSTLNNITASSNSTYGIWLTLATSNNYFTGLLQTGGNTLYDCYNASTGVNPGIVHSTCTTSGADGTTDYGIGNISDATYHSGIIINSSFIGRVSTDDAINTSDISGAAPYSLTMDWTGLEYPHRAWALEGTSDFPPAGACISPGACRIWDWSLSSADTALGTAPLYAIGNASASITQQWYAASTPASQGDCDAYSFTGSIFDAGHCQSTFLRNAIESPGDGTGNDNGLCESNETCIYTPNMGGYQGHGSLISAGTFTDGVISNVTLMKYQNNGY